MQDCVVINPHCNECGVEGELLISGWSDGYWRLYCLYCLTIKAEQPRKTVEGRKRGYYQKQLKEVADGQKEEEP